MNAGKTRWASIVSLAKGTIIAQLVFVLATPLLTRIYTAEEMGAFGIFAAIVLIAAKVAGLRYELAIPLPRQDGIAINLMVLTALTTIAMLLGAYIAYALTSANYELAFEDHVLNDYSIFIALGITTFVANETAIVWFIRKKEFGLIANARVINAVSLAVLQLLGFFSSAKLFFLVAAYPLALAISCVFLFSKIDFRIFSYRRNRLQLLKTLAFRYRHFPMYSTWSSTLFELSQALPLFVLSYFFGNQQAGYFFLARRIGLMPTSLVGRAIGQVNHADMLEHHKNKTLGTVMTQQIHRLQWISIFPAFAIACFTPQIFEILFGDGWRTAGVFLQLLTPYVVVRFVFSPLSAIVFVAEWQKSGFYFEIVSSFLSAACLIWFSWQGNVLYAVGAYFLVLCIANLVYWAVLMKRLDVDLVHLLKPAILQLPGIAGILLMISVLS